MTFYILCDIKGRYKGYAILVCENNPLLIYCSRDAEYQPQGDGYRGLKDHHPWEQGVSESTQVLESLSYENDLVVDPFLGSGTVAVACKRMKRRFVGCDVDQDSVNMTLARLAEE